jgi:uncharacterized membrane protein
MTLRALCVSAVNLSKLTQEKAPLSGERPPPDDPPMWPRQLWIGGLLLGLGLGGFFDGVVFHQLLQWHHLICSTATCQPTSIADLQRKTFADGLFHAACWVMSAAGATMLGYAPRVDHSGRATLGMMLVGWGVFNLVEGTIDHLVLGIHHVRPGPHQTIWDIAFLIWGALFVIVGWKMSRAIHQPGRQFQISSQPLIPER